LPFLNYLYSLSQQ